MGNPTQHQVYPTCTSSAVMTFTIVAGYDAICVFRITLFCEKPGGVKNRGFWSDVSVLTGDSDEGGRVERVGASLGGA